MPTRENAPIDDRERARLAWELGERIEGEVDLTTLARRMYRQDASLYEEIPLGVARPRSTADLVALVRFAAEKRLALIPRGGGTSLAGQCVGRGLVVDVSRHLARIRALDPRARNARVEPGVVQDDLNDAAAPHGLHFAPDTSTSRQAAIGGMIGNNSGGAYSILHGMTRDHVRELELVLGDGSVVRAGPLDAAELAAKRKLETLEGHIYRTVFAIVDRNREAILAASPKPGVRRRNAGYALDRLARSRPWNPDGPPFSLADLVCGSEGTLALVASALVRLAPRPERRLLLCAHFATLHEACRAARTAVQHAPAAVELMDGILLGATRGNRAQAANRFWMEGAPGAVLAIEFHGRAEEDLAPRAARLEAALRAEGLGYAFPRIAEADIPRVWELRKAGLGLLTGIPGDRKPVIGIEDTAVAVEDLPDYVRDLTALLERHDCRCAAYGHASVGLLHIRPMLNLKDPKEYATFQSVMEEIVPLVRRYRGSLSGEHGDGRLRAPLLRRMFPPEMLAWMGEVKAAFDPAGLFNPGKIVDPAPLTEGLRWTPASRTPEFPTVFDWSRTAGFVRAAEACNGVGLCRQGPGRGAMCPTYMATGEESHTTRARANVLRQLLTAEDPERAWTDPDLAAVLDTCISCKACATECPSSVDLARMKAEVLQMRHDRLGAPLRARLFGHYARYARLARLAPRLASWLIDRRAAKRALGIAPRRRIPPYAPRTFGARFEARARARPAAADRPAVVLLNDEFTHYTEPEVGLAAVEVLEALGFRVLLPPVLDTGRTQISKGFLRAARDRVAHAVGTLAPWAEQGLAIVGVEPSALLTFRDEAPDLVPPALRARAGRVRDRCRLFEEFVLDATAADPALRARWKPLDGVEVLLHGHCHQKALSGMSPTVAALGLIPGLRAHALPTACCGMAGSFGYEAEHYELSMRIGEQLLFPAIRAAPDAWICAAGTSCRHQVRDGTGRDALHPAQVLARAL